jgi:hypothetical protein
MALDATSGGTSSNAFCDVASADIYHSERLFNSEWSEASDNEKAAALIRATFLLNELEWKGYVDTASTQALRFPREELYDRDGRELTGIPNFLVTATCDLALELLRSENVSPEAAQKRVKAGSVELEYFEKTPGAGPLPEYISRYISFYTIGGSYNVSLVRS